MPQVEQQGRESRQERADDQTRNTSGRRRLLMRTYAVDLSDQKMSQLTGSSGKGSISRQNASDLGNSQGRTTYTDATCSPMEHTQKMAMQLSCNVCGKTFSPTQSSIRCVDCSEKKTTDMTLTLQPPTNRYRCDSGNGSDVVQSSGNVSPAYSDYGGGIRAEQSDVLNKNLDEHFTISPTDSTALTLHIPKEQQLTSSADTGSSEGMTTPTVTVWPAGAFEGKQNVYGKQDSNDNELTSTPLISHVEELEKAEFVWNPNNWVEEESNGTSSSDSNSYVYQECDDVRAKPVHRQMSESQEAQPPQPYHMSRQLSDSLSSITHFHERVLSRPSADSLTSLDGYFAQIHQSSDDLNMTSDSAFMPATPTCHSPNLRRAKSPVNNTPTAAGRTASEEGTSSTSPRPVKRKSLRERLSEKQLRQLKIDVSLKEKKTPASAPIGENQVNSLFSNYSQQADNASLCSTLNTPNTPYLREIKDPVKRWQALKGIMPFMENYKKQKWVQLAGHQGSFEQGSEESLVLKRFSQLEHAAFTSIFEDPLQKFVPKYHGTTVKDGHKFVELENLLHGFNSPSVMDCKIGTRTYLEEELIKAEKCPAPRKDMYEKMLKIDPTEPTEEEHRLQAVSKPRYMQWREKISSTSTLGFRIEGIKCTDGKSCINFKTSKDRLTIKTIISGFLNSNPLIVKQYLDRLRNFRRTLEHSPFFQSHEVIGSSLLFVHDGTKAGVWMIDFGKTTPLDSGVTVTHDKPWERGNHEDGYLTGLDNLTSVLQQILEDSVTPGTINVPAENKDCPPICRTPEDGETVNNCTADEDCVDKSSIDSCIQQPQR